MTRTPVWQQTKSHTHEMTPGEFRSYMETPVDVMGCPVPRGEAFITAADISNDADMLRWVMSLPDARLRLEAPKPLTASGIFGWPSTERRSDRYGVISLYSLAYIEDHVDCGHEDAPPPVILDSQAVQMLNGQRVRLVATVLATRESGHLLNVHRLTAATDEQIELGEGMFFTEGLNVEGRPLFGLYPDDERQRNWFDLDTLLLLHDQTVRLTFHRV